MTNHNEEPKAENVNLRRSTRNKPPKAKPGDLKPEPATTTATAAGPSSNTRYNISSPTHPQAKTPPTSPSPDLSTPASQTITDTAPTSPTDLSGLPPNWTLEMSSSRNLYYFSNFRTGVSQWDVPVGTRGDVLEQFLEMNWEHFDPLVDEGGRDGEVVRERSERMKRVREQRARVHGPGTKHCSCCEY